MTGALSRRRLLAGAGTVAAAATLTGCGDDADSGADGDGAIRFGWWGNDSRAELTRAAVTAFTDAHPDVTIETESSGFDGYFDRLAVQVASQEPPDVFQMNEWNLREYADRGALVALDEYGFSIDEWVEGSNGTGTVDGHAVGATAGTNVQAVMVNPDLFAEAGVDLPDDMTWTWQQFHELAAELTAKLPDGSYGTAYRGGDQISFAYFLNQLGVSLFTEDGVGFDGAAAAEWFSFWLAMIADGTLPAASTVLEQSTLPLEQDPFVKGTVAFQLIPSNVLVQYESTIGHDLSLLRIPTQTGKPEDLGMWLRASQLFCAAASSRHPEVSSQLIDFLLNTVEAGKILLADRGIPPNRTVREAIVDDLTPADQRTVEYMDACDPDLVPAPAPPPAGAGAYPAMLGRHGEDALFERVSPQQAGDALVTELQNGLM